ncbi:MAG: YgjV family protein [Clostridia bacterium]|nr:YgjV family protein [Clostridia bacterium]
MRFILAQIFGIIALVLVCIGYFTKTKPTFLIIQTIANFFYASAFYVVEAYVGAFIVVISIFRCMYLYFAEKHSFKYKIHLLPIFVVLYTIITIIFWQNPYDFMPLITTIMFTFGFTIKNMKKMLYFLIIPNVILVVYNILTTTYASALLDLIEAIVIVVAIIKLNKNKETKFSINR